MADLRSVVEGRRVLVTGHTGFKGSWLSLWLDSLGAVVSGLALDPPTEPSMYVACGLDEIVDSTIADIRDLAKVEGAFERVRPEIVFHLAAQPIVRVSYEAPVDTFATNVMGTVNVLEAARRAPSLRAAVVITSDKCYENREHDAGYCETDPLGGHDPYSASKACAELVTAAYARSFFGGTDGTQAGVVSARAGNVVGGGDWAEDRLVPDAARALSAGAVVEVRNPTSVRPWQHVLEPLGGYLMLARLALECDPGYAGAWNFGPKGGDVHTVRDVVDQLVSAWGSGSWRDVSGGPAPHEAALLALDSSKACTQLGWRSVMDLDEALGATAEWYKAFYAGEDMRQLTLDQIARYQLATEMAR